MSKAVINEKPIEFRQIAKKEPKWFYNIRKNGWGRYNETGLPERVIHLWKYTDPKNFVLANPTDLIDYSQAIDWIPNSGQISLKPEFAGFSFNRSDAKTLSIIDPILTEDGVIFESLNSAAIKYENIVGNYLGKLIGSDFGKFESLNLALWNTGLFLYVPDNVVIDRPIRLQRHPVSPGTYHRLLAIIGNNSEVTIIDDYSGECRDAESNSNSVIEIFAGQSSNIKYVNSQRQDNSCKSFVTQRVLLGKDAHAYSVFIGLGSSLSKVNAGSILNGRGAESHLYGMVFGNGNQHTDYHTEHIHKASDTYSNIDFKIALKDKANSAYTGIIRIEEDASNCQAYQENRNLLLNDGPRAESIPELEILNEEVQCSHGATVGQIDPEMLFYLKSRGLNHNEAVKAIINGFVEPTMQQLPDDLKAIVQSSVDTKLLGKAYE
ncbi:MAG: Fe-S cluster assembly protein SufD [Candidatus Zixiibacteriota bacterium]